MMIICLKNFLAILPSINFLLRSWQAISFFDNFLLIGIGIIYSLAAYFISQAYRISKVLTIAPFEYAAVPLSLVWSVVIFNDIPDIFSWIGFILICSSGIFVLYCESDSRGNFFRKSSSSI